MKEVDGRMGNRTRAVRRRVVGGMLMMGMNSRKVIVEEGGF